MDYRPREEEASLERARESLIAISYSEPEKVSASIEPEKPNTKEKAVSAVANVDELRAKLISIASDGPSVDSKWGLKLYEHFGTFLLNVQFIAS